MLTISAIVLLASTGHDPLVGGHDPLGLGHHAPAHAPTVERAIRTGSGDFTYESIPGWCALPDDRPLGNTHGGIVVDRAGNVYFNTDTDRSIMVYTPDGKFLRTFAKDYPALHSMVIRDEGDEQFIYAAHLPGDQVVKFTLEGEVVWRIGVPAESGKYDDNPGAFNPTAVAVSPDGRIYIADGYGRNWVHIYSKDREYVKSIGGRGTEPGQFQTCHGLAIDTHAEEPVLLVCDRENRRIQRFTLDGEFIDVAATDLRRPCAIAFFGDYLGVAELEGRVTILDKDFTVVTYLGDNPEQSHWANNGVPPEAWKPGIFTAPHSCQFDADGNLYVMDWNATGRISKMKRIADTERSD